MNNFYDKSKSIGMAETEFVRTIRGIIDLEEGRRWVTDNSLHKIDSVLLIHAAARDALGLSFRLRSGVRRSNRFYTTRKKLVLRKSFEVLGEEIFPVSICANVEV